MSCLITFSPVEKTVIETSVEFNDVLLSALIKFFPVLITILSIFLYRCSLKIFFKKQFTRKRWLRYFILLRNTWNILIDRNKLFLFLISLWLAAIVGLAIYNNIISNNWEFVVIIISNKVYLLILAVNYFLIRIGQFIANYLQKLEYNESPIIRPFNAELVTILYVALYNIILFYITIKLLIYVLMYYYYQTIGTFITLGTYGSLWLILYLNLYVITVCLVSTNGWGFWCERGLLTEPEYSEAFLHLIYYWIDGPLMVPSQFMYYCTELLYGLGKVHNSVPLLVGPLGIGCYYMRCRPIFHKNLTHYNNKYKIKQSFILIAIVISLLLFFHGVIWVVHNPKLWTSCWVNSGLNSTLDGHIVTNFKKRFLIWSKSPRYDNILVAKRLILKDKKGNIVYRNQYVVPRFYKMTSFSKLMSEKKTISHTKKYN